jgi:DNA-binding HxlR family transcriptional regulator
MTRRQVTPGSAAAPDDAAAPETAATPGSAASPGSAATPESRATPDRGAGPAARSYGDPCGIARALDLVGDRWTLLVVRELIFGPKRFVQVRAGLAGVSPNVLSQRLRELEDAGLVRRAMLEPPASVTVYELTERGRALEPVLLELGRWGSQEPVSAPRELSVSALLVALKTVFDPAATISATYGIQVDGQRYRATVSGRSIDIVSGRAESPEVSIETDVATLRAVAFGREPIADAERAGRLSLHGDRSLAEAFTRMFPVPARSARPGAPA